MLIGIGLGFTTIVFFQLFTVAGQFIAMQTGLGFASMVDPTNGISVTVVSQFFLMMVSLTFVAMNGHLVLLEVLIEGFLRAPLGDRRRIPALSWQIASLGSWMFGGAVLIALPAVTSLLVVNLALGVMTRAAPQLNIFSLGFPFSLLFGLVIIWVTLYGFTPQFEGLSQWYFEWTGGGVSDVRDTKGSDPFVSRDKRGRTAAGVGFTVEVDRWLKKHKARTRAKRPLLASARRRARKARLRVRAN